MIKLFNIQLQVDSLVELLLLRLPERAAYKMVFWDTTVNNPRKGHTLRDVTNITNKVRYRQSATANGC